jgi:hypothetical protein
MVAGGSSYDHDADAKQRVVPRSEALSAALEYAIERGAAIVPQVS